MDRVTVGTAIKKTLRLFTEQPGQVEAYEEAPILSKIPGYVDTVNFDIGDKVAKGDVLDPNSCPGVSRPTRPKARNGPSS